MYFLDTIIVVNNSSFLINKILINKSYLLLMSWLKIFYFKTWPLILGQM